jgi:hypothetical protein
MKLIVACTALSCLALSAPVAAQPRSEGEDLNAFCWNDIVQAGRKTGDHSLWITNIAPVRLLAGEDNSRMLEVVRWRVVDEIRAKVHAMYPQLTVIGARCVLQPSRDAYSEASLRESRDYILRTSPSETYLEIN